MKSHLKLEWSAIWTLVFVVFLFSIAVAVTLIAPSYIDPSWKEASCDYQVQMYQVADPNVYISSATPAGSALQYVYHLKEGFSLTAFQESEFMRILAPESLEKYVTHFGDPELKLTTRILFLQQTSDPEKANLLQQELQKRWKSEHKESDFFPHFELLELIDPAKKEAFAVSKRDGILEHWAEKDFVLLGESPPYCTHSGAIYVKNPQEYRVAEMNYLGKSYWIYQAEGSAIHDLDELKGRRLKFLSRKELIAMGEDIFRAEGCWYCHTDQTRTLVQDTVLNGSEEYPAPPSSANEYVFQRVTFPGTRRIGPDLSRVGIKRASRDWHMSHFFSPKTESKGSVMPAFKHFFDNDPTGSARNPYGIPNYRFEAVFQYLMTKGTRITAPSAAWWLGKDPIQTIKIIEGRGR
jgi:cytochrome c oxidase cbb3-type subunit II